MNTKIKRLMMGGAALMLMVAGCDKERSQATIDNHPLAQVDIKGVDTVNLEKNQVQYAQPARTYVLKNSSSAPEEQAEVEKEKEPIVILSNGQLRQVDTLVTKAMSSPEGRQMLDRGLSKAQTPSEILSDRPSSSGMSSTRDAAASQRGSQDGYKGYPSGSSMMASAPAQTSQSPRGMDEQSLRRSQDMRSGFFPTQGAAFTPVFLNATGERVYESRSQAPLGGVNGFAPISDLPNIPNVSSANPAYSAQAARRSAGASPQSSAQVPARSSLPSRVPATATPTIPSVSF